VTVKVKKSVAVALAMPTEITAQNGAVIRQNTRIGLTGCPNSKPKRKGKASRRHRHGKTK